MSDLTPRPTRLIKHVCGFRTPQGDRCNHPMSARSMRALGDAYGAHSAAKHGAAQDSVQLPEPR